MMAATDLLLIRHALTDWVGARLAGWIPGIHLNAEGRCQAADLAQRLRHVPLKAIYSSPLERAMETAITFAHVHGLTVETRESLGETRSGHWTGRSFDELKDEALWPVIQVYPGGARFPGGESMREVQFRVVNELDTIRESHPGQAIAVVCHSDPIKMAVAYYVGLPLDLFQRLVISPASVTAVSFTCSGPRLLCLNYTESLPVSETERAEEMEES